MWNSVQEAYAIEDVAGAELLMQACLAADRVAALGARIARDGEVIDSASGPPKAHPALVHELASRSFIIRVFDKLGLNFEPLRPAGGRPPKSDLNWRNRADLVSGGTFMPTNRTRISRPLRRPSFSAEVIELFCALEHLPQNSPEFKAGSKRLAYMLGLGEEWFLSGVTSTTRAKLPHGRQGTPRPTIGSGVTLSARSCYRRYR